MRFALALTIIAIATLSTSVAKTKDLTTLLESHDDLTQFYKLLTSYGDIYANLSFQQDMTVLAPTNGAFNRIPYSSLNSAFQNNQSDIIRSILQYHIFPSLQTTGSYTGGSFKFVPTWLDNQSLTNVTGGQVVGGVAQAGNVNILTSGQGTRSTIIEKDLKFEDGIVHKIDNFLIPPTNFISTCLQFNLTGLGGAVTKTSLDTYFNTAKDLTIFAPNNAAFQTLGSSALINMSVSDLSQILKYHVAVVVGGTNANNPPLVNYSPTLQNGTKLQTSQGGGTELTITSASNSLFVNSARILQQDILLSNGVMHIIDNVLNFNRSDIPPLPALETQPPVFFNIPGSVLDKDSDSDSDSDNNSDNDNDLVPYATYLPTTAGISSLAAMTDSLSVGVGDAAATTSDGSSAIATATATRSARGGQQQQRQSSGAGRMEVWKNGGIGSVLGGALVWMGGLAISYV